MTIQDNDRERLSGLERDYSHLDSKLSSVVKEMRDGFDTIGRAIEHQKTPMSQLAGWATVGLALIAAILWPQLKSDERHDLFLEKISSQFLSHVSDGHPRRVESKVTQNAKDIEKLDVNLQREMRDRDEITNKAVENLDTSLQLEMRLLQNTKDEQLKNIQQRLGESIQWMKDHDKRVVGLNAAQWERIKALERKAFGKPLKVEHGKAPGSGFND